MSDYQNYILVDNEPSYEWNFHKSVQKITNMNWKVLKCISYKNRFGKLDNLKRYFKYFYFPLRIFLQRKKIRNIISWQQFYGLIFAFYCRLFHVKKINKLIILTFIYKEKSGLIGKIYYKFMCYIVESKYIDKFVCFSSYECDLYSEIFGVNKEKFQFIQLGEDYLPISYENGSPIPNLIPGYIYSVGLSNRDYDFLINALKNTEFQVKIFGDKASCEYKNIEMSNEYLGDKGSYYVDKCFCMVIPFKDQNMCTGQLTVLRAMQLGKPVIVTESNCIKDYIINGVNGFIIKKDKNELLTILRRLAEDPILYKKIQKNAKECYYKKHTVAAMGDKIGRLVLKQN